MIRWGCFSSVRISKSDEMVKLYYKRGSAGLRLSHRDAWLEFGTISFGQNFFYEIVGTVWSASALFPPSANPWNYFSPRVWFIAFWQLSTKGRMRRRSESIGRKVDRSSAIWTADELEGHCVERRMKPWGANQTVQNLSIIGVIIRAWSFWYRACACGKGKVGGPISSLYNNSFLIQRNINAESKY